MKLDLVILPEAEEDANTAANYFESIEPMLGDQFIEVKVFTQPPRVRKISLNIWRPTCRSQVYECSSETETTKKVTEEI